MSQKCEFMNTALAEGRGYVYLSRPFVTGAPELRPSLEALLCGLNRPATRCPLLVDIVELKCSRNPIVNTG